MTVDPTTNPIAPTSRWMAAARARESERADRLFDDPLAAALAGPEGFAWLETHGIRRRLGQPRAVPCDPYPFLRRLPAGRL
ncbi:MAG: class I SAM-dependent methyltransferase [Actinomycetota bacterium]|nr:class I SAM-dependent methyltransferase [Actinomycetota bacterium]